MSTGFTTETMSKSQEPKCNVRKNDHNKFPSGVIEMFQGKNGLTDALKLKYSVYTGLLFLVVSSPQLYMLVQQLLGGLFTVSSPNGCPTSAGLLLHTLVFIVLLYGLMKLPI